MFVPFSCFHEFICIEFSISLSTTTLVSFHKWVFNESFCRSQRKKVGLKQWEGWIQIKRSRPQVFCKTYFLKNFKKFHWKPAISASLSDLNPAQAFCSKFCDTFKNTYFVGHLRRDAYVIEKIYPQKYIHRKILMMTSFLEQL